MRKVLACAAIAVAAAVSFDCHSYRPLETADRCACKPSEYCKVTAPSASASDARLECVALPAVCGLHPTCDCIGERGDACRDDDGRLTLLPPRDASSCDACSAEEYCIEGAPGARPGASGGATATCRLLPPECDATPTCACFLDGRGHAARFACTERRGHVVASLAK